MQNHSFVSVDLKITDFCKYNCSFCYQNSTERGTHAPLERILEILDFLKEKEVFEIVIGGGEPTTHPHLLDIIFGAIVRGFSVSITTKNPFFPRLLSSNKARRLFKYYMFEKYPTEFSIIFGSVRQSSLFPNYINIANFGFSLSADKKKAFEELKIIKQERKKNALKALYYEEDKLSRLGFKIEIVPTENIKLHLIEGIHFKNFNDIEYYAKLAKGYNIEGLLLLGFKTTGRGRNFAIPVINKEEIIENLIKNKFFLYNRQISVDSVFVNNNSIFMEKPIDNRSLIAEGERTFYIDAVRKIYSKSSYSKKVYKLSLTEEIFDIISTSKELH